MLKDKPIQERLHLAEQLREFSRRIAEEVTAEFLSRHPNWVMRYGGLAKLRGVEDAIFHQTFLAAAIESGEAKAFGEYLRWTVGVLDSRGIPSVVSQIAPGFAGYIAASCFPQAQGWAYTGLSTGNGSFVVDGDSDPAELVTLPRSASASTLLFPAVSNWNGVDTNITISNTSADPFGTTQGSGTCTISYFGEMLSGGSLPAPQVSSAIAAGSQLSFTLSQGNLVSCVRSSAPW